MKKSTMKTLAIALALVMMMSGLAFAATVPSDVTGKPYEEAVSALMDKKVITGDSDGLFHPDSIINRAQACKIVVMAMEPPTAEVVGTTTQDAPKSGFSDMGGYKWADGYVNYAVKTGVTNGYGNGKFGPGDKVSSDQLATMILRAAGYSDKALSGTWPENYVKKGQELALYEEIPENMLRAAKAPKWVAAQMTYNMLEEIEIANVAPAEATKPDGSFVPGTTATTFGTGSFNANMTSYAGREIASNVKVYTYGLRKDYKTGMALPTKADAYREDTIYKYKNAQTPCFYTLTGGKISNMIIPMDAGFSGNIYGVINAIGSVVNGSGEGVPSYDTLTAAKSVTWLASKGLTAPADTLDGSIFEMYSKNGEITAVSTAGGINKGKLFDEISGNAFMEVDSFEGGVIKLTTSGTMFGVKSNAGVYVLADDLKSYKVGSASSISKGKKVRAYDITDDKDTSADLIVVTK